ncbi:DNA damage-inducible protein D [Pleomorphomonas sp. PLEO]|uniref:DNA damage-inducible protein D n=1 Tax=Pleomorphomonas sp. PLEO TaxID=3239306 RepID=UPI00351E0762
MIDKRSDKLSSMPSDEALQRLTQTDPQEVAILSNASMKDGEIERLIAEFENASQFDDDGFEFWSARTLSRLLEYSDYRNFLNIIEKAKIACANAGQLPEDHFGDVTEMVELGSGAVREIDDMRLTRYACYLITQNGDARKKPVAFGQTYFAIQTRRQELSDQAAAAVPASEDEKRVFLRNQIKEHNIKLSSAAKDAGVVTSQEFAIFHSKGYQGLYGKTVPEIRRYKGLPASADILDRMGSTELAANFFRVTQTEEKLRKDKILGLNAAYATHYAVGRQVRDAMLKISGIAPEDLAVADNIKNAEKRIKSDRPLQPLPLEPAPSPAPSQVEIALAVEADPVEDHRPIDLRKDLWKFALLVMALRTDGVISTSDLIAELPNYIHVPDGSQEALTGRNDNKFSQIVRNLKSHKTAKTNFIFQGYAEDTKGGFRITAKGREFVKTYFAE